MKILFLPGKYPFCYYYRGFLPGVYSGQTVVKDFMVLVESSNAQQVVAQAKEADVVVFQRPNTEKALEIAKVLKKMKKKVIFENDDSYKLGKAIVLKELEDREDIKNNYKVRQQAKKQAKYTDIFLELADGAIASTQFLADEFKEINPNTVVLKNCIDPLDEFPVKQNTTGKFRIGFIASVATNDDYLHITEQIRELDSRDDVTIVVFGVKYKDGRVLDFMKKDQEFWGSLKNVEWHSYVPATEYMMTLADLALDLCVIPRKDSYFNRCKSNLKFLEMALLRIPVVAQGSPDGLSPYQGVDEKYMTIVNDNTKWKDVILHIKDNLSFYRSLADKAHEYVLENYNIKTYANTWVKEIENLCKYQKSI